MQYTKLIKILWIKEGKHWGRMGDMLKAINSLPGKIISWPILCVIISVFHYCFAVMHFLFETFLYFFNHNQYQRNMLNLEKSLK